MARFTVFHSLDLDRGKDERISDCCRSDDVFAARSASEVHTARSHDAPSTTL